MVFTSVAFGNSDAMTFESNDSIASHFGQTECCYVFSNLKKTSFEQDSQMDAVEIELATKQIEFAREYTNLLLADVQTDEWFRIPDGAVSHLGWQMGHLAMAQYGLVLLRIRGKEPEDKEFITKPFMRCFMKGTTPVADADAYPTPDEIRTVFDAVFQQAMKEISGYSIEQLSESLPMPTAVYENKLGSLLFCSMHEMLHAGQIGTLRRGLGKDPLR